VREVEPVAVKRTLAGVERLWRAIESGVFYPAPSVMSCGSCGYREACRAWMGSEEAAGVVEKHLGRFFLGIRPPRLHRDLQGPSIRPQITMNSAKSTSPNGLRPAAVERAGIASLTDSRSTPVEPAATFPEGILLGRLPRTGPAYATVPATLRR
jgi:hypothetical protein